VRGKKYDIFEKNKGSNVENFNWSNFRRSSLKGYTGCAVLQCSEIEFSKYIVNYCSS
jgi:hypothetical protein